MMKQVRLGQYQWGDTKEAKVAMEWRILAKDIELGHTSLNDSNPLLACGVAHVYHMAKREITSPNCGADFVVLSFRKREYEGVQGFLKEVVGEKTLLVCLEGFKEDQYCRKFKCKTLTCFAVKCPIIYKQCQQHSTKINSNVLNSVLAK